MKKCIVSLLMALTVLTGLFSPALAAEGNGSCFTDEEDITHLEAVTSLVRLEVMHGKEDGSYFDPKGTVTRAEAAKLVVTMLTGGKDLIYYEGSSEPSFTDTQGHWAELYIDYCKEFGLVGGRGDGSFDPNGLVTGVEFTKMVLAALGYDPVAYLLTGPDWDVYTNRLAAQVCDPSLYEGLLDKNVVMSDPLTREKAAQILYNMLSNTVIMATPNPSEVPGEVTFTYAPGQDKNGQNITFLSLHFSGKELEKASAQPES